MVRRKNAFTFPPKSYRVRLFFLNRITGATIPTESLSMSFTNCARKGFEMIVSLLRRKNASKWNFLAYRIPMFTPAAKPTFFLLLITVIFFDEKSLGTYCVFVLFTTIMLCLYVSYFSKVCRHFLVTESS